MKHGLCYVSVNDYQDLPILKSEISDLKSRAESISRQLRAWSASLQDSDIRGQRYLTSKTKIKTKEAREREEFLRELDEVRNRKS